MGRWIEVRNNDQKIIAQGAPHLLIYCIKYLPKSARVHFPVLSQLDLNSEQWTYELQVLSIKDIKALQKELKILREIISFQYFIEGVDNQAFYNLWKEDNEEKLFHSILDDLEELIQIAIKQNLEIRIGL